jgi:hypothetical protein
VKISMPLCLKTGQLSLPTFLVFLFYFLGDKSKEDQNKVLIIFNGVPALLGIILVSICLLNPWVALVGYTIYILNSINPVRSLNRLLRMFARMIK